MFMYTQKSIKKSLGLFFIVITITSNIFAMRAALRTAGVAACAAARVTTVRPVAAAVSVRRATRAASLSTQLARLSLLDRSTPVRGFAQDAKKSDVPVKKTETIMLGKYAVCCESCPSSMLEFKSYEEFIFIEASKAIESSEYNTISPEFWAMLLAYSPKSYDLCILICQKYTTTSKKPVSYFNHDTLQEILERAYELYRIYSKNKTSKHESHADFEHHMELCSYALKISTGAWSTLS